MKQHEIIETLTLYVAEIAECRWQELYRKCKVKEAEYRYLLSYLLSLYMSREFVCEYLNIGEHRLYDHITIMREKYVLEAKYRVWIDGAKNLMKELRQSQSEAA